MLDKKKIHSKLAHKMIKNHSRKYKQLVLTVIDKASKREVQNEDERENWKRID